MIFCDGPGTTIGSCPAAGLPHLRVSLVATSVAGVELGTGLLSKEVILMARVIVLPDAVHLTGLSGHVLLDERVDPVNLDNEDSSLQFIERFALAIQSAEGMQVATP